MVCEVKKSKNYTHEAELEAGLGEGSGMGVNGNGKGWGAASFVTKVIAGVVTAAIIAGIAFGAQVYAFMNAGERFTPKDGRVLYNDVLTYTEEHYVREETLDARFNAIQRQLDRIEDKIDELQ